MKNIKILILIILFASIGASKAQTLKLSLSDAIELAADSSLQIFRAKNLYMASYWEYRAYRASRLPSLTLEAIPIEYNHDLKDRYDWENNIEVYRRQQFLQTRGNLSINQNWGWTGGTFFIDSDLAYRKYFGENSYTEFSSIPIRIGYIQPLFGFNEFKWQKKIEPLKYEKAQKEFLYNVEDISQTVIEYFFDLAMAQAELDMAKENSASSDTLYRIGQERYKIASISQSDLLTLKLDAVNAKNTLKNAEITLKRSMFSFVSFLNLDKDVQIELNLPEKPKDLLIPVEQAVQYSKENNPDYLLYKQEILEAERDLDKAARSSNFDASFNVSVGFNQVGNTFKDAYRNPSQQDIVSMGISVPIIDWGVRKGKANMAKNNLNVARISVQQKIAGLEQDVIMTVNDFNIQQDMMASAEEAMELANTAYNITKQRFIIGKADINSLTLSLNRQKDAQKNYISTLKNYWLSYYKIRKLTLYDFEQQKSLPFLFDEKLDIK